MQATINNPVATTDTRAACRMYNCVGLVALILLCAALLFANLGAAALFEPDEGRNAEKAREILLLHDWVTPHENFLAVLDKPMPYYWLVAASYKLFGVSEWTARLPSALAGAGCVVLVFLFARRFFGLWPALWSSLILVSSLEFYLFSRIVIFDMTLTFFMTLSLFCFFAALHEEDRWRRRSIFFFMYFGLAAATLVKGPIGVVLPGLVALAYLTIARKLSWLRRLDLPLGIVLFFAIVAPWYVLVEISNPGYSRYFLWEENFIRYLTPHFNRTQGWYYFFYVLAVGFFPWTICVPEVIKQAWRKRDDDTVLLVSLWVVLPFIFFSFSSAKLPHYILPIYPPLAILSGVTIERKVTAGVSKHNPLLAFSCLSLFALIAGFTIVASAPQLLPSAARYVAAQTSPLLRFIGLMTSTLFAGLAILIWSGRWKSQTILFVGFALGVLLYINFAVRILEISSLNRSTRELVRNAAVYVNPTTQIVIYDTSFESLPFYLRIDRPIWIVWSGRKAAIMGSFYVAEQGARAVPGAGKVLLTFDQFKDEWARAPQGQLLVFMKKKNLPQLEQDMANTARPLAEYHDLVLVSN